MGTIWKHMIDKVIQPCLCVTDNKVLPTWTCIFCLKFPMMKFIILSILCGGVKNSHETALSGSITMAFLGLFF